MYEFFVLIQKLLCVIFIWLSWFVYHLCYSHLLICLLKEWAVVTSEGVSLLDTLYKALDEVVKLTECEIYGYVPDSDADPLLQRGAIWSFNFFFYNRKLKRIVAFRCSCFSNLVSDEFLLDETHNEDDGVIFADMDIWGNINSHVLICNVVLLLCDARVADMASVSFCINIVDVGSVSSLYACSRFSMCIFLCACNYFMHVITLVIRNHPM